VEQLQLRVPHQRAPPAGSDFAVTGKHALADPPAPEHRARLVQLAYTILSPALGHCRHRLAHAAVDHALLGVPAATEDVDYPRLRARLVRRALVVGRHRAASRPARVAEARRARSVPTGAEELVWLLPAARAAYALHHLEGLDVDATQELLSQCGVGDPVVATELADRIGLDRLPAFA
jgi:hypothetical protein